MSFSGSSSAPEAPRTTPNPMHIDVEVGSTGAVHGAKGYSRRVVASLAVALFVATGAAIGCGGYIYYQTLDSSSSSTPTSTSGTSMTAHMENALAVKPTVATSTLLETDRQSPWCERYSVQYNAPTARRLLSLPEAATPAHHYSTAGTMLVLKNDDQSAEEYRVYMEMRGDSPLGTFVHSDGNHVHSQLVLRIHDVQRNRWGFLVPLNFAARNVSRLADLFYFYADGEDGFVRTEQRSDLLFQEKGRRVWDQFFVPYMQRHATNIVYEMAHRGKLDAGHYGITVPTASARRLGQYGDMGREAGTDLGGDVGKWAGEKAGSWLGSKVGGYAGGAIGGAIGAEFGGPIGYEVGEWAGSELGSWAGGKIGGEVGGDLGQDWGGDVGGDLGQDAGDNFDDGSW